MQMIEVACAACGGEGWADGMAELRLDRGDHSGDTTCVFCKGSGKEPRKVPRFTAVPTDDAFAGMSDAEKARAKKRGTYTVYVYDRLKGRTVYPSIPASSAQSVLETLSAEVSA